MERKKRIIRLSHEGDHQRIRFLSDRISLADGDTRTVVNVTRTGKFSDPRYGRFNITRPMLETMVKNFEANVVGQEIALDVAHMAFKGAAGYFKRLFLDGNKLRAEVDFTPYGVSAVRDKGMKYLSAEYDEDFVDNEEQQSHGATLLGAGLTIRPVIKRLDPVQLSEDPLGDSHPTLVSERIIRLLNEDSVMWKKLLEELTAKLKSFKLSDDHIKQITNHVAELGKDITDEKVAKTLCDSFEAQGKTLAEAIDNAKPGETVSIKLDSTGIADALKNSQGSGLTEEQVKKLMADDRAALEKTVADQKKKLADNQAAFDKALDDAEGLSDDTRKQLGEDARDLITGDMTDEQVKKLATTMVAQGNKIEAAKKLAERGYSVQGSPIISVDDSNSIKKLQEDIDKGLKQTPQYSSGRLRLCEKANAFTERVLAEFDRLNAHRLHNDVKRLAGESVSSADTSLPASFQRTVIREALSDLRVLELVQTLVDTSAQATMNIPYEERDISKVVNDGVVYEGQGIPGASIQQKNDLGYITPMKIAMEVTNEVIHFSRNNSLIAWDAWARNLESNARVMRELVVRRICNHMQREADAYGAVDITGEDFSSQLDGSTVSTIKTAQYPIVRPWQKKDLAGNNVGTAENAISILINSVAVPAYDGTGTQSPGTYYRITNYNLGYIQFVNETGTPVTPAATAGAETIDYSYATNIVKFDLDVPAGDKLAVHLNGLLRAFGGRKAVLADDRFVSPNFALMSHTLNDTFTNAEQFTYSGKKSGTDTTAGGDLEAIKAVEAFATNAPGIDLGDERALIGERGAFSYGISKPFQVGEPFEAVNAAGQPTGKKKAYGEEYNTIHVPIPLRERFTSVIAYSFTAR